MISAGAFRRIGRHGIGCGMMAGVIVGGGCGVLGTIRMHRHAGAAGGHHGRAGARRRKGSDRKGQKRDDGGPEPVHNNEKYGTGTLKVK